MWMENSTLLIRINSTSGGEVSSSEQSNSLKILSSSRRRHRQNEFDKETH